MFVGEQNQRVGILGCTNESPRPSQKKARTGSPAITRRRSKKKVSSREKGLIPSGVSGANAAEGPAVPGSGRNAGAHYHASDALKCVATDERILQWNKPVEN